MTSHAPEPALPGPDETRLGMGVIGAGRVGAVVAAVLAGQGHAITGVTARSDRSRERAAALIPNAPVLDVDAVVERSEVVWLTVPDDALTGLVARIAPLIQAGQICVHTSGRYGTDVLAPLAERGAICLAVHPAMTFTGTSLDLPRLAGCPIAVTARATVLPVAQALAVELGGEPVVLAPADRSLYHAALSHGANHLNVLVSQARLLLREIGVENPGAVLSPLLHAALDEALERGDAALTGPVARGDVGTVEAHLSALTDLAAEAPTAARAAELHDILTDYRALARTATRRARDRGALPAADAAALEALLAAYGDHASPPPDEGATPRTPEGNS